MRGVSKRFRRADGSWNEALQDVDLEVRPGEAVTIVGPSGAGKTTLMRLLNLSLRPDAGTLLVDGVDPSSLSLGELRKLRARTATVYQQHHLVPSLRVVHNILAGRLSAWPLLRAMVSLLSPREADRAAQAASAVGLLDKLWERTDHLSGGQQQRVAIARALVQNPRHLLADEPVASVDPSLADSLVGLLRRLSGEEGKTLIVNLHDVPLALRHFERIVGLRAGRVFFDLPSGEVDSGLLVSLYEGDKELATDVREWLQEIFQTRPSK
ncbi:MAG: phosphonate ABC transporter ATP-binding protein [Candidatus Tectomicrobia bacterium]|nr:phosphonate ABC transporter ATP-binding protein [Candidatus Tectomicrobia bacterium]